MVATTQQIIDDIKSVLPIYDDEMYENQLTILVNGAMNKLKIEGVDNIFEYQSSEYYDYITCLRYQVASDMDLDIDIDKLREQYITRVNTLRCITNVQ